MVLEALEALQNETLGHTLIAGANVQEEVGLRGSKVSVNKFKPDLFFAVDCSADIFQFLFHQHILLLQQV